MNAEMVKYIHRRLHSSNEVKNYHLSGWRETNCDGALFRRQNGDKLRCLTLSPSLATFHGADMHLHRRE